MRRRWTIVILSTILMVLLGIWIFYGRGAGGGGGGGGYTGVRVPVYQVTGRLMVDGKPAKDAYLVFYPADQAAPRPTATVDEAGKLTVTTYTTGDGAPAGEYQIGVEWPTMHMSFGRLQPGEDRLGGRFKGAAASGWMARVAEEPSDLGTYDLKSR